MEILTPSHCVFCSLLAVHTSHSLDCVTLSYSRTKREWLHCFAGVCLVFLGQQGDYYCRKSCGCCWWCQIIMHKQTNLQKRCACQGSLAMLEVNQQEEEKNFSYRLLTGSSFILSIIHPNEWIGCLLYVFTYKALYMVTCFFFFFKPKWPYSLKCIFYITLKQY